MAIPNQKAETTRHFTHLALELRDNIRQFMQQKFRENNIDLTSEMHQIMACLWRKDGVKQQELADLTLKDKASMTFLIDNLTKRGLVKRAEDAGDRRSKLIYLTAKGRQLGKKVEPWVIELFTIACSGLKINEIRECTKTVEKMRDNIKHELE
ncbi:MAG: MarR family winged helix-turn-helix transcriptional regulator [Ginsengibacter sp.]